jgi:hypothetical protein
MVGVDGECEKFRSLREEIVCQGDEGRQQAAGCDRCNMLQTTECVVNDTKCRARQIDKLTSCARLFELTRRDLIHTLYGLNEPGTCSMS